MATTPTRPAGQRPAGAAATTGPARDAARTAWVRRALADDAAVLERASVDAGFRSHWRATAGTGPHVGTTIVMDAPPGLEDAAAWLRMHALLHGAGVRVPRVLVDGAADGFLLLEDLGGPTLAQSISDDTADAHFEAALAQLLLLQSIEAPAGFGTFGEALLQRDAGLFEEWFLARHLGLTLDDAALAPLREAQRLLMDNALGQAQVVTHRDFMPRNLMPVADGPAVIDFQDLVLGPVAYDPASLFKDAFSSWPLARVDGWLGQYHARAQLAGIPVPDLATFRRDADWMGIQRHLKILGIFARLHYRDAKPKYLTDVPRFRMYLDEVLPRHPSLAALRTFLETHAWTALDVA